MKNKEIVILGGGFAGVESAITFGKKGYDVTLVSERDYLFIYPISIWIPTKGIAFDDAKLSLYALQKKHGFKLVIDSVVKINASLNNVELETQTITYDYLVIALGMTKVKMPGIENTLSICGAPDQATAIQEKLETLIQKGGGNIAIGFGGNPKDAKGSAVRGGPAFELMFNISTYLKKKRVRSKFNITFFAPMPKPGIRMGEKAYGKLDVFLKHYNITAKKGVKINRFETDKVVFDDGSELASDMTMFIAGGTGLPLFKESGLPVSDAGFIITDEGAKVDGYENVYAIGDSAELMGPQWAAKQGHTAEVMGRVAAFNIMQHIQGNAQRKIYTNEVNIVCVMDSGDGAAFVKRTTTVEKMIMLPFVGHLMKKGWGWYFKNSKLKRIPRLPGM